jgi:hypothetical protein
MPARQRSSGREASSCQHTSRRLTLDLSDGLFLNHWSTFLRSLGLIATPIPSGYARAMNVADCLERLRTKLDARGEVVDPDLRRRLIDQHSIDQDVDPDGPLTLTITIEPPANPSAQRQRINALRELARARWNAEVPEAFAEFHERVHRLSFVASSEQDELWSLGFETATIAEVLDACATRYRDQPIVPIIEGGYGEPIALVFAPGAAPVVKWVFPGSGHDASAPTFAEWLPRWLDTGLGKTLHLSKGVG